MSNILNFPTHLRDENYSAKDLADGLVRFVTSTEYQDETKARFWLANELMWMIARIEQDKAFTFDEVIGHVIDERPEVYALADSLLDEN